jgi:hypothetical protein
VVVAEGETLTEPDAEKEPATPEIVTLVAFAMFQLKVELPPRAIVVGEAVNDDPATVGHGVTETVACN